MTPLPDILLKEMQRVTLFQIGGHQRTLKLMNNIWHPCPTVCWPKKSRKFTLTYSTDQSQAQLVVYYDDENFERGKRRWQRAEQLPDAPRWDTAQIEDEAFGNARKLTVTLWKLHVRQKIACFFHAGIEQFTQWSVLSAHEDGDFLRSCRFLLSAARAIRLT